MLPRVFLGVYYVDRWGYLWGYTIPQINLLAIDAPLVVYNSDKNKGKPTSERIQKVNKEWEKKYGEKKGQKIDLTDLLSQYTPIQ